MQKVSLSLPYSGHLEAVCSLPAFREIKATLHKQVFIPRGTAQPSSVSRTQVFLGK